MLQIFINGIYESSAILLVAIGFTLIYGVTRFFHIAHGAIYMIGGYLTYLFFYTKTNILISIPSIILICALCGIFMEVFVYKRLRKKKAPRLIYLIASLGLLIVFQSIVALIFGNEIKAILISNKILPGYRIFEAVITQNQIYIIGVSALITVLILFFLKTKFGLMMRAIADNNFLANAIGINVDLMMIMTFAIGSGLAGIAGGLVGIETTIHPWMGFSAVLYAILACIVGGIGNVLGTMIGSLVLGMVKSVGITLISPEWKDSIALCVLLLILMIRPGGILGKAEG